MATVPAGAPPAALSTPTTPQPLGRDRKPDPNVTWDATALGGKGAWVTNVNGSPMAVTVDPTSGLETGAGTDPKTGAPIPTGSQPDGKGGWKAGTPEMMGTSLPGGNLLNTVTNALEVTNPAPTDISKGDDVQAQRDLAAQLRAEHSATAAPAAASRDTVNQNLSGLQGVANGTTPTAADALLTKGTDTAARDAAGMAAAYSRGNPGLALRAGLATGSQDYAKSTADAAALKANEQATARGQIGQFAGQLQGEDQNRENTTANTAVSGSAAPVTSDYASQAALLENQKNNAAGRGSVVTALVASDKRVKDNIAPVSLADSLAKNVHGVSFSYKGGTPEAGTKHVGVLAQDLEKAVPGVVSAGPDGVKKVDTAHLSLSNTGTIAELAKRLRDLEGKKDDDAGVKWGPPVYAREPAPKPITMRDAR